MPGLRSLVARIRLQDETGDGVESAQQNLNRLQGTFSNLAAGAAAIGAALVQGINEGLNRISEIAQTSEATLGATTSNEDQLLAALIGSGYEEGVAAESILATRRFGLEGGEQQQAAGTFANLSRQGVGVSDFAQFAQASGLGTPFELGYLANLGVGTAQQRGVAPGGIFAQLAEYQPVFEQAGFSPSEQISFAVGLEGQGIGLSRVGPAFNQAVRQGQEAGLDRGQIRQLLLAGYETGSIDLFGAEGGLRLTEAAESGVQLGGYDLINQGTTVRSTRQERAAGVREAARLEGGAVGQFGAYGADVLEGISGDIPIVGGIVESSIELGVSQFAGQFGGGTTVNYNIVNVQGSVLSQREMEGLIDSVVNQSNPQRTARVG